MGPTLNVNTNKSGGLRSSIKASTRRITSSISPVKQDELYALAEKAIPTFSTDRSSTSSRSSRRSYLSRRAASSSVSLSHSSEANGYSPLTAAAARHQASASIASPIQQTHSLDPFSTYPLRSFTAAAPFPYADLNHPSASIPMATASYTTGSRPSTGKPSTAQSNVSFGQGGNGTSLPPLSVPQPSNGVGTHNPHTVYQHVQDMSSKRISTLDYLRKA
ncbi:MAG: hypothetical protein Q9208_002996 [Pyrenodesmia sp. 3 TL-2023]